MLLDVYDSSYLNNILDTAKQSLIQALVEFGDMMRQQLTFLGVNTDRVERVRKQQIASANNKVSFY